MSRTIAFFIALSLFALSCENIPAQGSPPTAVADAALNAKETWELPDDVRRERGQNAKVLVFNYVSAHSELWARVRPEEASPTLCDYEYIDSIYFVDVWCNGVPFSVYLPTGEVEDKTWFYECLEEDLPARPNLTSEYDRIRAITDMDLFIKELEAFERQHGKCESFRQMSAALDSAR